MSADHNKLGADAFGVAHNCMYGMARDDARLTLDRELLQRITQTNIGCRTKLVEPFERDRRGIREVAYGGTGSAPERVESDVERMNQMQR